MKHEKHLNPSDISRSLLKKYNRSGPRYTSYPTAPQFREDIELENVKKLWLESDQPDSALSIYSHFPFCRTRCLYCGCFTQVKHSLETRKKYLRALHQEARELLPSYASRRLIHQIALGGGTPTYMGSGDLAEYIHSLRRLIPFAADAEISLEIDPRSVDTNYLDDLIDAGFNRFSFGVQDLNSRVQKNIRRPLEEQHLAGLLQHLHSKNEHSINIDLMYGLPGQTPTSISNTVNRILALHPSRIALFGYAHVPWVSPHQKALETFALPDPEERMELFGAAFDVLIHSGYEHIGMDHFALPEDDLFISLQNRTLTRNFMGYTSRRGLDLMGLGVSSISSVNKTYVQNHKDIPEYNQNPPGSNWHKGYILNTEDLLRREIILDLFCNFFLDLAAIEKKWDIAFPDHFQTELIELAGMEADGLMKIGSDSLKVTRLGRFFIRNICMTFDQYIRSEKTQGRYSKTI